MMLQLKESGHHYTSQNVCLQLSHLHLMAQDDFNTVLSWFEVACRWSMETCVACWGRKEGNGIASVKAGGQN